MSCPWAKIQNPEPVSLLDIMSEEVAKDLQAKEDQYVAKISDIIPEGAAASIDLDLASLAEDETCDSDEVIARMLQMQFDREYDDDLKRTQDAYNKSSKISISFENYRRVPQNLDYESEEEEDEEDVDIRKISDQYTELQKEFDQIPACGYRIKKDGSVITKHDIQMSGRKNACKMLSFPPDFQTGDGEGIDMQLSNKVFNSLKLYSKHEEAKRHKLNDKKEDRATAEFGLDEFTRLLIYKLINSQEMLEGVHGVISIGKEAVILHADSNPEYTEKILPKECAIKVFKTTVSEFKQRDKYIKDDYRFKDRIGKQTSRKSIHLWAEKEMRNLNRLRRAKIPCPEVVVLKKHVLVMGFIGKHHRPAPKLKDANLSMPDLIIAYDQVVSAMKSLYTDANLIHADLSEFNILWHNDQCYIIDVSQSVEPIHENAFFFLMRDCNNVTTFFTKRKVPEVDTPEELFKSITGCDYDDKVALTKLQNALKMKPHNIDQIENNYDFDKAWNETQLQIEPTPA